jgi:Rrf2 family protein
MRAMLEIALHGDGKPVDLNEISKKQGISKKYLHTLLMQMKNGGFITSVRGNTGGYLLARRPEEITLFDIYTTLEGPPELVECVANEKACTRSDGCVTRKLWDRIGTTIRRELEGTTLADLVRDCGESGDSAHYDI